MTGDRDTIGKAEGLATRKESLEDNVNKYSMQKNVLIGQQMEELGVLMLKVKELADIKEARRQHLLVCVICNCIVLCSYVIRIHCQPVAAHSI